MVTVLEAQEPFVVYSKSLALAVWLGVLPAEAAGVDATGAEALFALAVWLGVALAEAAGVAATGAGALFALAV